jgi:hypothetical protein
VDHPALAGDHHPDDGGGGADLLRDARREAEVSLHHPGSVLAVVVWIIASLGFAYYVKTFADYNAMYGSIGAIIVLLLYFYISAAVLLLGAEMNAVIEHMSAKARTRARKTSTGKSPRKPSPCWATNTRTRSLIPSSRTPMIRDILKMGDERLLRIAPPVPSTCSAAPNCSN